MWSIEGVAAFYEGEGYFGVRHNPYGHPTALRCSIAQRNLEPLEWCLCVLEVGRINHRHLDEGHGGEIWYYNAGKTDHALHVARVMWPYLSERRQLQILGAVDEFLSVPHRLSYDTDFVESLRSRTEV